MEREFSETRGSKSENYGGGLMDFLSFAVLMAIVLYELTLVVDVLIYKRVGRDEYCQRELGPMARWLVRKLGLAGFLVGAILGPVLMTSIVAVGCWWVGQEGAIFAAGVFAAGCLIALINDIYTLAWLRPDNLEQRAKELLELAARLRLTVLRHEFSEARSSRSEN